MMGPDDAHGNLAVWVQYMRTCDTGTSTHERHYAEPSRGSKEQVNTHQCCARLPGSRPARKQCHVGPWVRVTVSCPSCPAC